MNVVNNVEWTHSNHDTAMSGGVTFQDWDSLTYYLACLYFGYVCNVQWKSNFPFHSKDKNVYHSTLVIFDISKTTGVKWIVSYCKSTDNVKKVTQVSEKYYRSWYALYKCNNVAMCLIVNNWSSLSFQNIW